MANFHEKLYQFAEYDLKALIVLRDNNMFAHAIYHYVQCFENVQSPYWHTITCHMKSLESPHIEMKLKLTLQSKVKEFEEECKKPTPDQSN